jgi:hypothetical protein
MHQPGGSKRDRSGIGNTGREQLYLSSLNRPVPFSSPASTQVPISKPATVGDLEAGLGEPRRILLEEKFDEPLSPDWFWGLGAWTAKDGVLRGFESGPRRHGPVKLRKFTLRDGVVECEFRLEGKATFAGIIFNGSGDRGHLVHVVMGRDTLSIIAHPKKDEKLELLKQPNALAVGDWHQARIEFSNGTLKATVDGKTVTVKHACLAEEKTTFGFTGDSGGPDGEKAGALEFRRLRITALNTASLRERALREKEKNGSRHVPDTLF